MGSWGTGSRDPVLTPPRWSPGGGSDEPDQVVDTSPPAPPAPVPVEAQYPTAAITFKNLGGAPPSEAQPVGTEVFDIDTSMIWLMQPGGWEFLGVITGLKGDPGEDGTDGTDGTDGAQGPPGVSGARYIHHQEAASTTWVIAHQLGTKPLFIVFTDDEPEVMQLVEHAYDDLNHTTLIFDVPVSGYAYG